MQWICSYRIRNRADAANGGDGVIGCLQPGQVTVGVSDDTDLCDLTYTCKNCGATTTRTIKIEKQ